VALLVIWKESTCTIFIRGPSKSNEIFSNLKFFKSLDKNDIIQINIWVFCVSITPRIVEILKLYSSPGGERYISPISPIFLQLLIIPVILLILGQKLSRLFKNQFSTWNGSKNPMISFIIPLYPKYHSKSLNIKLKCMIKSSSTSHTSILNWKMANT